MYVLIAYCIAYCIAYSPWAKGRGRDPSGQGPGPGPFGPGAWGPLGPRCRIRVESVTTYCQASYLQSGKLPTVRQSYLLSGKATYSQASYLLSGMHPNVAAYFAPNNRIHAPNRSIDMHPKGIDMHPNVSIYFAPNNRILFRVTFFREQVKN